MTTFTGERLRDKRRYKKFSNGRRFSDKELIHTAECNAIISDDTLGNRRFQNLIPEAAAKEASRLLRRKRTKFIMARTRNLICPH
jgi:hypothetical protein